MNTTRIGNYRWTICALVFFATTINYLDRTVISLLKPSLEKEFAWTETDYSNIVIAFQLSYAIGLLFAGAIIDKLGTKLGYFWSILLWSVAAVAHAIVGSTGGFVIARSALGVSEAGNFPSAIKTVAEWFPKKERALATGIFNSGTGIGAILAPLTVPFIAEVYGWKMAFILTGLTGFILLAFWWSMYEKPGKHKRLSAAELHYIESDPDSIETTEGVVAEITETRWGKLMNYPATWAFVIGKFLTDPIWWFYLFWLPAFLKAQYGISGTATALHVALVYVMSMFGSIGGGYIPLYLTGKGWDVIRARRSSMLIYALFAVPVLLAQWAGSFNMWFAVIIIGLAAAGHQAWSANIFTTVSDRFSKPAVGSVVGLGGMAGAVGGILIARLAGKLFDHYKALDNIETGYYIMFLICGSGYLLAWFIMKLILSKRK
ncbi:MAG: MFS transporter [Chitinophagaceae bacterium]